MDLQDSQKQKLQPTHRFCKPAARFPLKRIALQTFVQPTKNCSTDGCTSWGHSVRNPRNGCHRLRYDKRVFKTSAGGYNFYSSTKQSAGGCPTTILVQHKWFFALLYPSVMTRQKVVGNFETYFLTREMKNWVFNTSQQGSSGLTAHLDW